VDGGLGHAAGKPAAPQIPWISARKALASSESEAITGDIQ